MSGKFNLWHWLLEPVGKPRPPTIPIISIPPPNPSNSPLSQNGEPIDDLTGSEQFNDLDARSIHKRKDDPRYRTDVDPKEVHWGPQYNSPEAINYNPKFDRHTWRQWLLVHGQWPVQLTYTKLSDRFPWLFSQVPFALLWVCALIFIAISLILFLTPIFQTYFARLWAAADGIF